LFLFNNNRERAVIIANDICNNSLYNAAEKIGVEIKIPLVTPKQKN